MYKKGDFKIVADRGKKLRNDTVFVTVDDTIYSATTGTAIGDTAGAFMIEFSNDTLKSIVKDIGTTVVGKDISSIISGTKFESTFDNNICRLTSSKGEWVPNSNLEIEENLCKMAFKYKLAFDRSIKGSTIQLDINDLLERKKFVLNLSSSLNVKLLLLTNKMIKNLSKDTTNIEVTVTNGSIIDDAEVKICRVLVEDSLSKTYSYYAFLD